MKNWQIENSEISKISEIRILFEVYSFPSFQFCPKPKNQKSRFKNSEKISEIFKISHFSGSLTWSPSGRFTRKKQRYKIFMRTIKCFQSFKTDSTTCEISPEWLFCGTIAKACYCIARIDFSQYRCSGNFWNSFCRTSLANTLATYN